MSSRLAHLGIALLTTLGVGTASAHEGETHSSGSAASGGSDPLALALLASGALVLGAGLYLTQREDVERTYALTGIGLGVAALAGATVTYLF